ncbi:hypothetical protein WG906_10665 [Pedobacter sp. P351]|uniref:hypothetical protein n=1 Tax=Pedobacter superstes TaxID=3133441 RepID=UPI0030A14B79
MKKSGTPGVSPFIILLIPALIIIGLSSTGTSDIETEKQQASIHFQLPSLKGMIKSMF